ncbi:MAG: hypothetical protein V2J65_13455 [Desulfobacteraceae bacterium]|jgi:hypothetical protein|nr:hypothetical protein [Desulfobacteraceae bacterium]
MHINRPAHFVHQQRLVFGGQPWTDLLVSILLATPPASPPAKPPAAPLPCIWASILFKSVMVFALQTLLALDGADRVRGEI